MVESVHNGKNRLLAALSPEDRERYFAALAPLRLAQKDVLYEVGAPMDFVYFIEDGLASVVTTMAEGASVEVGMTGREGMVGVSTLLGHTASAQHVVVQVAGSALRMSAQRCKAAFEESAAVRKVFLRFVGGLLHLSTQTAACNRLHSLEQRCARWLLLANDRVQSDVLALTHEYLAIMLGVRRAGVTEAVGNFQHAGLIRHHHGRITLLDRDGLIATACECYRHDRARFEGLP